MRPQMRPAPSLQCSRQDLKFPLLSHERRRWARDQSRSTSSVRARLFVHAKVAVGSLSFDVLLTRSREGQIYLTSTFVTTSHLNRRSLADAGARMHPGPGSALANAPPCTRLPHHRRFRHDNPEAIVRTSAAFVHCWAPQRHSGRETKRGLG